MDPEEYYDSLDESSDYEDCKCPKVKKTSAKLKQHQQDDDGNTDESIPFYEGNLSMSLVDFTSSKSTGILGHSRKTSRPRLKLTIVPKPKPKKSYLEIFYNKTGANKYDIDGLDSSRPTCSSSSPKSFTTCDGDVCDDVIDVDLKSISEISSEMKYVPPKRIPILDLHMDSGKGDYKIDSVIDKNESSRSNPINNSKKNSKDPIRIPKFTTQTRIEKFQMPTSKLESWKKRQQYGRKASETNRIQMQEKKVLQTLEKEIKN